MGSGSGTSGSGSGTSGSGSGTSSSWTGTSSSGTGMSSMDCEFGCELNDDITFPFSDWATGPPTSTGMPSSEYIMCGDSPYSYVTCDSGFEGGGYLTCVDNNVFDFFDSTGEQLDNMECTGLIFGYFLLSMNHLVLLLLS